MLLQLRLLLKKQKITNLLFFEVLFIFNLILFLFQKFLMELKVFL